MSQLLVIAETNGTRILPATLPALAFAQEWARETGGTFALLLLLGTEAVLPDPACDWLGYGAEHVILVERPAFSHPVADQVAAFCVQVMQKIGATLLAGPASSFGRDVLPRVAGLLDLPMVSSVMQIRKAEDGLRCRRPMYAGQTIATVQIAGEDAVFSVHGTAYGRPEQRAPTCGGSSSIHYDVQTLPKGTTWGGREEATRVRPDLTSARVVVAGGRPLRDKETFERLIGGLADRLGGAVGATGGAVGAGLAPNELLIGQTGKTVAPDLYIAAGISGSDQHVAGMRDSKVIVAINTDPDATMLEVADYALVADVHQALPAMIEKLARP